MSINLKPCPFCGGEAQHNDGGNSVFGRFWWIVGCVECGIRMNDQEKWETGDDGSSRLALPPKECFERWNRRDNSATEHLADKIEDLIAEFGDDPTAALQCVSEYLDLRRHGKAEVQL